MAQYVFGKLKSSGKIISIKDVPKSIADRRGFECVCPNCGADLTAHRGDVRVDHFVHKTIRASAGEVLGCSAGAANETALHRMAKEIFLEEVESGDASIWVPPVEVYREEVGLDVPHHVVVGLPRSTEYKKARELIYTAVVLEENIANFRPDVVIETVNGKCCIEIRVTHPVDEEKKEKARLVGVPMLEIDLGDFYERPRSREELRTFLMTGLNSKTWIVRPDDSEALKWGRDYYGGFISVQTYRAEQQAKKEAAQKREHRFRPENYKRILENLEHSGLSEIKKLHFCAGERVPFFVNIPIEGEIIFNCDRRVWQSAMFDQFIYYRASENVEISVDKIINWIKLYQKYFSVDWSMLRGCSLLEDVITTYLSYLSDLGFVSMKGPRKYILQRSHSVIPPNRTYATALETAIQVLGNQRYSPQVDRLIDERLEGYRREARAKEAEERKKREAEKRRAEIERQREVEEVARKEREAFERAAAEEAERIKREKERILNENYGQNDYVVCDSSGNRYAQCKVCNKVYITSEMAEYGGLNKNTGICRFCVKDDWF